eukprot:TRINITY_DN3461_c0_g3_i1.p1 TRINITY_DN3461_c0_g3~~TRINITY_DN3461_c0_g3_i1.p1  ORF type:complete len:1135 (+),score=225.33 TRINITY_DN3461_c0_g3_i1:436-3405(+)
MTTDPALKTIYRITQTESTVEAFIGPGFIPLFIKILSNTNDDNTFEYIARIFMNMFKNEKALNEFRSKGGVSALVKAVQSSSSINNTLLILFCNFLGNNENQKHLEKTNVNQVVVDLFHKSTDPKITTITLKCLWNLAVGSPEFYNKIDKSFLIFLLKLLSGPEESQDVALKILVNWGKVGDKKMFTELQGVDSLIKILSGNPSSEIQILVLSVFANLLRDGEIRDQFIQKGGIKMLLNRILSKDEKTINIALGCLANFTGDSLEALQQEMTDMEFKQIVGYLNSSNPDIRFHAIWATANMLINENIQQPFINAGGIKSIVGLLGTTNQNPDVIMRALTAVLNLSTYYDDVRKSIVVDHKALNYITPLLSQNNTQEYALRCLGNLSIAEENDAEFVRSGTVSRLLSYFSSNESNLQEIAFLTLSRLALNREVSDIIREKGGIDLILSTMKQNKNPVVIDRLANILGKLALNSNNRRAFQQSNGAQVLQSLIASIKDPEVQKSLTSALNNLSFPVTNDTVPSSQSSVIDLSQYKFESVELTDELDEELEGDELFAADEEAENKSLKKEQYTVDDDNDAYYEADKIINKPNFFSKLTSKLKKKKTQPSLASVRRPTTSSLSPPPSPSSSASGSATLSSPLTTPISAHTSVKARSNSLNPTRSVIADEQKLELAKRHFCRTNIANELLQTEGTYVRNLALTIKKFKNPLMTVAQSNKPFISSENVRVIFSCVEIIYNYNSMLLEAINERMKCWHPSQKIGDIFLKMIDFLKSYVDYVNNYDIATQTLLSCRKSSVRLCQFLASVTRLPQCQNLELEMFLIMPVQRIPRYSLLFRDLIRKTDKDHIDYKDLCTAMERIDKMSFHLNQRKSDADNHLALAELAQTILKSPQQKNVPIIIPNRKYLKDGDVIIYLKNIQRRGRICLFNDSILVARRQRITNKLYLIDLFPLANVSNAPQEALKLGITKELVVEFPSVELRDSWVEDIKTAKSLKK